MTFTYSEPAQNGWICPKCGAVWAPFMPRCENLSCRGGAITVTRTDNVTPCPHTNTYTTTSGTYCAGCGQFVKPATP